jgi:formate dehydrogenase major subunit/NADH-quinone oxidoreductase subunit G
MGKVTLTINGKQVKAPSGQTLLWAALDNGIDIPNLCAMRDRIEPEASCRLCWVEIEGKDRPVTACTETVAEGMVVNTRGEKAVALARAGLELLMASHALDCAHCPANGTCELQKIARVLGCSLKPKRLRLITRDLPVDASNPLFTYDANKCVLCGRCIWVCRTKVKNGALGFAHRGFARRVTTFADEPMGAVGCADCAACVMACPTGALAMKDKLKVKAADTKYSEKI